ncbi:unnamed protein product [Sphenostylis stenocarpa]|uniref:Uncharacterized protein n=1 Tax=Sphenostylis stenocarpa TaxID=92480 RepID=A0AA86RZV0_9FABA|nr:unnamed protein product [Sphenostylis stenocarpa]
MAHASIVNCEWGKERKRERHELIVNCSRTHLPYAVSPPVPSIDLPSTRFFSLSRLFLIPCFAQPCTRFHPTLSPDSANHDWTVPEYHVGLPALDSTLTCVTTEEPMYVSNGTLSLIRVTPGGTSDHFRDLLTKELVVLSQESSTILTVEGGTLKAGRRYLILGGTCERGGDERVNTWVNEELKAPSLHCISTPFLECSE